MGLAADVVNGVVEDGGAVVEVEKSVVVETGGIVKTFVDINGIDVVVVVNGAFPVILIALISILATLFDEYVEVSEVVLPIQSPGRPTEKKPTCSKEPSVKLRGNPVRLRVPRVAVDATCGTEDMKKSSIQNETLVPSPWEVIR